ncbi:MAG TPA: trehalose-phosphatase [Acidimicrobiales bacterium]
MTTVAERLTTFRADPAAVAVVLDYDGTLSPIVADAAAALPQEGVPELLARLRDRLGLVAVVSGRPIDFLAPLLPPGLVLAGLYGLELAVDDQRLDHPQSGNWREVVDDVAGRAEVRGPAGVVVERKGLSLTLHYRTAPDQEAATAAYAAEEAHRSGLVARPARMSWELHPPIEVDKGTAVLDLADDFAAVAFAGDDVGDLPGFDALDELADRGVATLRIAVDSPEAPPELLERADIVVDGPQGLVTLLESLA